MLSNDEGRTAASSCERDWLMLLRFSEWIWVIYWGWIILLLCSFRLTKRQRIGGLLSSSSLVALLLLLPYGGRLFSPQFLSVARDWLPLPMILAAYYQTGLLISGRRDHAWEPEAAGMGQGPAGAKLAAPAARLGSRAGTV